MAVLMLTHSYKVHLPSLFHIVHLVSWPRVVHSTCGPLKLPNVLRLEMSRRNICFLQSAGGECSLIYKRIYTIYIVVCHLTEAGGYIYTLSLHFK